MQATGTPGTEAGALLSRNLLTGEDLEMKMSSSIGDTLMWEPGVTSSSYGPGSSRPVIRGFSGYRVRVLQDGIGTGDISDTSPDHGVSIEPLLARSVEVLRGPATLLHGGAAIGGVVDVETRNIPDQPPQGLIEGALSSRWESVSNGATGVGTATVGNENWAFQLNGLLRRAEDYSIPGRARRTPSTTGTNPEGRLPSTWLETDLLSIGGSRFWEKGWIGASFMSYDSRYGVPFHSDAHTHLVGVAAPTAQLVSVDLRQRRTDIEAELDQPFRGVEHVRYRAGISDYTHAELEGASLGTRFEKQEFENKIMVDHSPLGGLSGGLGASFLNSHFLAQGPEVNTPESYTRNFATYLLETYDWNRLQLQVGGRWEVQEVEVIGRRNARIQQGYHAFSLSTGLEYTFLEGWEASATLTLAQRPPSTAELFSNGPHLATGTYEIGGFYTIPGVPGSGGMEVEKSQSLEFSLKRTLGRVTGSLTGYQYRFQDYIFLSSLGPGWQIGGLPIYRYIQTEARFRGVESETTFHLFPEESHHQLDFTTQLDWVQADDLTAQTPLPRMPPLRFGGRLEWKTPSFQMGLEARRASSMDRIQRTFETPTEGYTQINADLRWNPGWRDRSATLFVKASNLTNVEIRNHASVIKDVAPLPGRNITLGITFEF